jgi:hypothetical protein
MIIQLLLYDAIDKELEGEPQTKLDLPGGAKRVDACSYPDAVYVVPGGSGSVETVLGRKSRRFWIARRTPPTVRPSRTSATSTNPVITRTVKNSPIAKAERRAMVIESSIVIFRSTMFSNASLKMGYPPIKVAAMPTTLMCGNGSATSRKSEGRGPSETRGHSAKPLRITT